jgi:hypothetical protein
VGVIVVSCVGGTGTGAEYDITGKGIAIAAAIAAVAAVVVVFPNSDPAGDVESAFDFSLFSFCPIAAFTSSVSSSPFAIAAFAAPVAVTSLGDVEFGLGESPLLVLVASAAFAAAITFAAECDEFERKLALFTLLRLLIRPSSLPVPRNLSPDGGIANSSALDIFGAYDGPDGGCVVSTDSAVFEYEMPRACFVSLAAAAGDNTGAAGGLPPR